MKQNNNIQALQNLYHNYHCHRETSMDIGAVVVGAAVGVGITALTGGGGLALAVAAGTGAIAGSQQFNIDATTNTISVNTVTGSSLLFNNNLSIEANKATVDASAIKADTLTVNIQDGDKNNGYGGMTLQSSNDTSMLVNETFEQRTDYLKFAGYQAAMTYAVGKLKAALEGLGILEKAFYIVGAGYTIGTYNRNIDGELSLTQKIYTNQDTDRSEYSSSTEVNSSVLFDSLVIR